MQELADAPADALVAEFGPRMGVWYHELGQGLGPTTVDDAPWVPRGHSRETTFQQNLTTPEQVRDGGPAMAREVVEDTAQDGRPVVRVAPQGALRAVRHHEHEPQAPRGHAGPRDDRRRGAGARWTKVEDREIRLLGVRAEMAMPDDADPADRTPVRGRI